MAHKTLVNGTAYNIIGGKTLVGGTGYSIKSGKTLVNGTGYDILFEEEIPEGSTIMNIHGTGSYTSLCILANERDVYWQEGTYIIPPGDTCRAYIDTTSGFSGGEVKVNGETLWHDNYSGGVYSLEFQSFVPVIDVYFSGITTDGCHTISIIYSGFTVTNLDVYGEYGHVNMYVNGYLFSPECVAFVNDGDILGISDDYGTEINKIEFIVYVNGDLVFSEVSRGDVNYEYPIATNVSVKSKHDSVNWVSETWITEY
jgi:hypothetical protein